MKFYVLMSNNAYASFEGMSSEAIEIMLTEQGFWGQFVTKETYLKLTKIT